MRLTLPLLAKSKAATLLSAKKAGTLESYLSGLKATQLKSLARETGIPSSGRKDELRQRLCDEFVTSVFLDGAVHHVGVKRRRKKGEELSVLSIDMGIQNLAFAHLIVRAPETLSEMRGTRNKRLVTLNAWHRIGVQELGAASPARQDTEAGVKLQSLLPPSAFRTFTTKKHLPKEIDDIEEPTTTAANKNFEPDTLSHNAYVLLSSLLQAYNPTHILIERQRFRSGGQSAVLEWSLRVGVFEGMLHAVLCTMRELARVNKPQNGDKGVDRLKVYPISPARIMQFWDGGKKSDTSLEDDDGSQKAKSRNERGVKGIKMDIVGDILSASNTSETGRGSLLCWDVAVNTADKGEQNVGEVVNAYLRRWKPQLSISTKSKPSTKSKSDTTSKQVYKIDKMDDLADCLLQGLTWLEWQARRARIVRGDRPLDI
ncbi:hypothetical protein ZTR_06557 [Talaromyces verruculosus]|nr:hypothetical protein ZTR_06557 [Talaromyces verruculosus]